MKKLLLTGGLLCFLAACSGSESILFDYTADSDSDVRIPASITLTMEKIPERVCLRSSLSPEPIPAQIESASNLRIRLWWQHDYPAGEKVYSTALRKEDMNGGVMNYI